MISAISFGNSGKYVSEATIFTIEEAKKAAKVAQEAIKKDLKTMQQRAIIYGYNSPFVNVNIPMTNLVSEEAAVSYARSHGNPLPVKS